jgi:hypothetical protein
LSQFEIALSSLEKILNYNPLSGSGQAQVCSASGWLRIRKTVETTQNLVILHCTKDRKTVKTEKELSL